MPSVPTYRRIYDDLATRIRSGELPADSRIEGEQMLAERYGVARMTVRQAIAQLVDESLVVRQQGVGTFVTRATGRRSLNRLTGFTEDLAESGRTAATSILAQEVIDPPDGVGRALGLSDDARVVFLSRLRTTEQGPVSLLQSFLPSGAFPLLARVPLLGGSLYRTLQESFGVRLKHADQRVRACGAEGEVASLLDVAEGTPLLAVERLTVDARNTPIEFARTWARPEIELTVRLER
jgi:GntR family transcriptional regulator